jgi:tripeptidyl-peptidase-1
VPQDYATSVCNAFAQLGARGVSLFFGSGDDGVGTGSCESNTGTKAVKFQPMFPASCASQLNPDVQLRTGLTI